MMLRLSLTLLVWLSPAPMLGAAEPVPNDGAVLYFACAGCHGSDGAGDPMKQAPNITGFSAGYISLQLQRYASGARGAHADDTYGRHMTLIAPIYRDQARLRAVSEFVAGLPWREAPIQMKGNVEAGRNLYLPCAACHGMRGEGNADVSAVAGPRLAGMSDWFLVRQYRHYQNGVRGADPAYAPGLAMAAFAKTQSHTDEQLADMATFLATQVPGSASD